MTNRVGRRREIEGRREEEEEGGREKERGEEGVRQKKVREYSRIFHVTFY